MKVSNIFEKLLGRQALVWFFILILGLSVLPAIKTSAQVAGAAWLDKTTIVREGVVYRDLDVFNQGDTKDSVIYKSDCAGEIWPNRRDSPNGGTDAILYQQVKTADGKCFFKGGDETDKSKSGITIGLANSQLKNVTAYQISPDKIFLPIWFSRDSTNVVGRTDTLHNNGLFIREANNVSDCIADNNAKISHADGPDKDKCVIFSISSAGGAPALPGTARTWVDTQKNIMQTDCQCAVDSGTDYPLVFANNRQPTQPDVAAGYNTSGDSTGKTEPSTCETSSGSLAWIMCPVINMLAGAVDGMYDKVIGPQLKTETISFDKNDVTFKAWSQLRIYGNILLIIGLLVIVFGQSIGGGVIDAYTAKKVLPRILIAALMINLSIYLVAILVDITNIGGVGINKLLASFAKDANGSLTLTFGNATGGSMVAIVGALFAAGAVIATTNLKDSVIPVLLLFVLLPAFLAFLGVVVTLVLRRGLIMLLVIVSPVAFALYVLPNTEKYFKQWGKILAETLLIYPIIGAIFGLSTLMATTVNQSGTQSGGVGAVIGQLMSIVIFVVPICLIPFAFRMAENAIGKAYGTLSGWGKRSTEAIKGNPNDPNSARNKTKYKARSAFNDVRNQGVYALGEASKKGPVRRRAATTAAKLLNYGNLQGERAMMNEEQEKIISSQYSMGDDSNVRALWAIKQNQDQTYVDKNGMEQTKKKGHYYSYFADTTGKFKEWAQPDVDKANALVGKDPSRLQSYAKYEIGKAAEDGVLDDFLGRADGNGDLVGGRLSTKMQEYGYSPGQAEGVWAGDKFAHQGTRRELKHATYKRDANGNLAIGSINHSALSTELADAVRSYDFANFRPSTARAAKAGFVQAQTRINNKQGTQADIEIVKNYTDLANNLAASFATGRSMPPGMGEEGAEGFIGRGTGGSARADIAWKDFINTVNPSSGGRQNNTPPGAVGG
jgi:hypothetical protein